MINKEVDMPGCHSWLSTLLQGIVFATMLHTLLMNIKVKYKFSKRNKLI